MRRRAVLHRQGASRRSEIGDLTVHLLEPTGHGGIFQHTVALARTLVAADCHVVLHAPPDHEPLGDPVAITVCPCVRWRRRSQGGRARALANVGGYFLKTLPHLLGTVGRREVLHVEGAVRAPLAVGPLALLRLRGSRAVFSPHNTFSRAGSRRDAFLLRAATRIAHANVVFSDRDEALLREWGSAVVRSPLIQVVPEPQPEQIRAWRARWGADDTTEVVLFAGQIRRDKRLDLLIASAADWPTGRRLAVAGEDRGDWPRCLQLAAQRKVEVEATVRYLELEEFVAAIAAADALVAPYDRASQSGVLVLARHVGTPVVASEVGGLAELATATFPPDDVAALRVALDRVLDGQGRTASALDDQEALAAHRAAYAAGPPAITPG